MKSTFSIFIFLFTITFVSNIFSSVAQDTVIDETEYDDENYEWDDAFDDLKVDFKVSGIPTIIFEYGLNNFTNKATLREYNKSGKIGTKIGFSKLTQYEKSYILKLKDSYFMLNNFSKDFYKKETNNNLNLDIWQFGFGWSKGYGYKTGDLTIIPYKSDEMIWTRIKFKSDEFNPNDLKDISDKENLELYNENFRFGTTASVGAAIGFFNTVGIDINYKRMVVFPRHLFWYNLGSVLIESIGDGTIDWFVNKVFKSSPAIAPIIYLLFKAAYSYGINEMRKEKMNWPFDTAKPLFIDQFNIGLKLFL